MFTHQRRTDSCVRRRSRQIGEVHSEPPLLPPSNLTGDLRCLAIYQKLEMGRDTNRTRQQQKCASREDPEGAIDHAGVVVKMILAAFKTRRRDDFRSSSI